jgi:hypothetical protein
MATRRFTSKEVAQLPSTYVGQYGEIWIGDDDTVLRVGNSSTPGGIAVGGGSEDPLSLTNTGVTFGVWLGDEVHFVKENNGSQVDEIATGISITRGPKGYIFNPAAGDSYFPDESPYVQNSSDPDVAYSDSPTNTEWNADGWGDLANVTGRSYTTWDDVMDGNPPGLIGQELVMHDITNDAYHTVKFLSWQSGNQGGGFSYVRREINVAARFTKTDNGSEEDAIAPGLVITRGENGGIYNVDSEEEWDEDESPVGTLWNIDGWDDLSDVTSRQYLTFYVTLGSGNLGKRILGKQLVMHDTINDQYWKIMFTHWTPNGNGGGFSYVRERIDTSSPNTGILFADGTNQVTAFTQQKLGVVPQLTHAESYDRWLNLGDMGKHILVSQSGVDIYVPDYKDQPFPVGTAITIVNVSGGTIRVRKDNDDEGGTIYGAGTPSTDTWWAIPDLGGGNIATLIKIAQYSAGEGGDGSVWMLSGPGIEVYED